MRTFSSRLLTREGSLVADESAWSGVVFIPPVMSRIPAFCTFSSLSVLLLAAGAHAADTYF